MTSSNWNIFRVTGPLYGEFTCHRWIPLTKTSGMELWCFLWINCWVNNREAGDLRRHRAHYDITVMSCLILTRLLCNLVHHESHLDVKPWKPGIHYRTQRLPTCINDTQLWIKVKYFTGKQMTSLCQQCVLVYERNSTGTIKTLPVQPMEYSV